MKAGIIGLGHGSRVLIHSFKISNIKVCAISAKNLIKTKKISKINKINIVYENWIDLIKDKSIDIIAIAVPPIEQIKIINECIKRNKLIFCEKPIGIKKKEIDRLFVKLFNYKEKFIVDYIFPEHNAFKKFKEILDSKKINSDDIVNINFNNQTYVNKYKIINWKSKDFQGGGIINQFLTHILDYLIIIFGKITEIRCEQGQNKKKLHCYLNFKSGIKANISIDTNNSKHLHLIEYHSKNYKLILVNNSKDYCKNFKIYKFTTNSKNQISKNIIQYKNLFKQFRKDSRILMTSRIIDKLKLVNKKYDKKNYLNRMIYNEFIFEKCRISAMKKNIQRIK